MEDQFQTEKLYSAEDAIFDENEYALLTMEKTTSDSRRYQSKKMLIALYQRRDIQHQTCFLHFLSKQLIRELVHFLSFSDFFAFTGTCKRYSAFLSDPYVDVQFPYMCQSGYLYDSPMTRKDISEGLRTSELRKGRNVTKFYSFYRSKQVNLVHIEETESGLLFYSAYEDVVHVWKMLSWGTGTEDVQMLEGLRNPSVICGSGDEVALSNSQEIRISSRSHRPGFSQVENYESYTVWKLWTMGEITHMSFASTGEYIVTSSEQAFWVMSATLDVLSSVPMNSAISLLYVPHPKSALVILYSRNIISIYNLKKSLEQQVGGYELSDVRKVLAHSVRVKDNRKDYLLALTFLGYVYANQQKLATDQVGIELTSDYLLTLNRDQNKVNVYQLNVKSPNFLRTVALPHPVTHLIPTQEKLIFASRDSGGVTVGFMKYNGTRPFYSCFLNTQRLDSLSLHAQVLVIKATSWLDEECLLLSDNSRLVHSANNLSYNALLPDKPNEEKKEETQILPTRIEVRRNIIEAKRPKKSKSHNQDFL